MVKEYQRAKEQIEEEQRKHYPQQFWVLDLQKCKPSSKEAEEAYKKLSEIVKNSIRVINLMNNKNTNFHKFKKTAIYTIHQKGVEDYSELLRNYRLRVSACQSP